LCLFLAALVIIADTIVNVRMVGKISAVSFSEFKAGTLRVSPGAREESLVLPYTSMDARWWVLHTENLLKTHSFRARETILDNAPQGRDVHWSSLLIWILAGLASLISLVNGQPAWTNVAEAAMAAGPLMLIVSVLGLAVLVSRRFGWTAAVLMVVVFVTNPAIYRTFRCGEADHHGIAMAFSMTCLLCLMAGGCGFTRPKRGASRDLTDTCCPPLRDAEKWFRLSGVLGAAALWISAAAAIPILFATALGGLLTAWFERKNKTDGGSTPELWSTWGISGCIASLCFYTLEYFPDHLGWRLEVNHPVYALSWLGGGFLMARAIRLMNGGYFVRSTPADMLRFTGCVLLAALPVALIATIPQQVFWVSDPFLLALHQNFILEFQSMFSFIKSSGNYFWWSIHYGWPFFAVAGTVILWWRGELTIFGKRSLALLFPPALITQSLALHQIRWSWNASMGIWSLCVLALFIGSQKQDGTGKPAVTTWGITVVAWFALVCSLAPQLLGQIEIEKSCLSPIKQVTANGLILRDIAHRLIQSSPSALPVVLSGPDSSTELAYYGGIKTLGTLYWENMPGLKRAAAIFAARDDNEALQKLTEAGVSHIVIPSWDNIGEPYARLYTKYESSQGESGALFFKDLLEEKACPQWLRPLCYPIPTGTGADSASVKIFAVVPQQSLFESFYYRGIYYWESKEFEKSKAMFEKSLAIHPRDPLIEDYLRRIAIETQSHEGQ